MKKLIAFTAICSILSVAVYFSSCKDKKNEPKSGGDKDTASVRVARGEYLANNVAGCMDCHSKRDFSQYSGPLVPGTEGGGGFMFNDSVGVPGMIYSRNITPDNETGIGTWTDDDILKAVTQGISKRGDTLFPLMPYVSYNHMAKEDLLSIIAYLRTLKPIKNKIPDRVLFPPISEIYGGLKQYLLPSIDSNMAPSASDKLKYGEYLTNMAVCFDCHSPMTQHGPDMSRMYAGGYTFKMPTFTVNAANITPDSATGIGTWNEAQFLEKFTKYREEKNYNFNPGKDNTIMPLTLMAGMKDEDLKAIYAYLRTVRPISNKVEKYPK